MKTETPFLRTFPTLLAKKLRKWRYWLALRVRRDPLKYDAELDFWRRWKEKSGGSFSNAHYGPIMLAMADQDSGAFLRGKVVADFGCGPAGSLCWATEARTRIGIDVLVDEYRALGMPECGIRYVRSTEKRIPLPSGAVDVLYTMNALDHVSHLAPICGELIRILAPWGSFFGSFNLHEPRAACEPQTLTWDRLQKHLLTHLDVYWYAAAPKALDRIYDPFLRGTAGREIPEGPAILWVRARKRK